MEMQMDGFNDDIKNDQVQKIAQLFPEVVTEGKIDWTRLKATLGEDIDIGERYGLNWKGKSEVFAKIQEKTTNTLHPQQDESVDWDTTQNMFIEGDNLEALKILHKSYYGKIKMIYIDPPYNTGNDFIYDDNFKKTIREQRFEDGDIDEEGYTTRDDGLKVNNGGYKHSNWLDMMYPRLFLARNLLTQDGVIFVSIDDNEVHNLRLMMNEIFGEENFISEIVWEKMYTTKNDSKIFSDAHEYIVCYARNINIPSLGLLPRTEDADARYKNPDNDLRGAWKPIPLSAKGERKNGRYPIQSPLTNKIFNLGPSKHWLYSEKNIKEMILDNRIWFGKDGNSSPNVKRFLSEVQQGMKPRSLWKHGDVGSNDSAKKEIKLLFGENPPFDFPKPVTLISQLLKTLPNSLKDSIILDFFSGSGTLAHAVNELNADDGGSRKWICVQLPELTDEKSEAYKAGYKKISDIAKERIRRASKKIAEDHKSKIAERENPLDLGFRAYTVDDSNFKKWNELLTEPEDIKQQTLDNIDPILPGSSDEELLTELLLKRGISPLVEIEKVGDTYFIPSERLVICLDKKMTEKLFDSLLEKDPNLILCLDKSFNEDINLKTNLELKARRKSITLETV